MPVHKEVVFSLTHDSELKAAIDQGQSPEECMETHDSLKGAMDELMRQATDGPAGSDKDSLIALEPDASPQSSNFVASLTVAAKQVLATMPSGEQAVLQNGQQQAARLVSEGVLLLDGTLHEASRDPQFKLNAPAATYKFLLILKRSDRGLRRQ